MCESEAVRRRIPRRVAAASRVRVEAAEREGASPAHREEREIGKGPKYSPPWPLSPESEREEEGGRGRGPGRGTNIPQHARPKPRGAPPHPPHFPRSEKNQPERATRQGSESVHDGISARPGKRAGACVPRREPIRVSPAAAGEVGAAAAAQGSDSDSPAAPSARHARGASARPAGSPRPIVTGRAEGQARSTAASGPQPPQVAKHRSVETEEPMHRLPACLNRVPACLNSACGWVGGVPAGLNSV